MRKYPMDKIKQELVRYKWILIIGLIVGLGMSILAANIHVIQFFQARMEKNTQKIMDLLAKDMKNEARQDEWYFKEGILYLVEEGSAESLDFLETHLGEMTLERQYDILYGYNKKSLLLNDHTVFMQILMENLDHEATTAYLKRIDPDTLDQELFYYFGDKPDITNEFVDTLYKMLVVYPKSLPLKKFQFSLYPILTMTGEDTASKRDQILSKLQGETAKTILFKELKTRPIELQVFNEWIELLHRNKILTSEDYTGFANLYRELQLVLTQYRGMDEREVDLMNKKQMIEVELGDKLKLLESSLVHIQGIEYEITSAEQELEKLTDYAHIALYIDKAYGNNEYEASVPRKNIFGNYKPSSQKYILKLNTTAFYQEGVYYVDVYLNGTKTDPKGNEYPYYIEVPKENLERINILGRTRETQIQELSKIKGDTAVLQQEVDAIKQATGYEENEEALQNLDEERASLLNKINEKIVQVKNLFQIGNLTLNGI